MRTIDIAMKEERMHSEVHLGLEPSPRPATTATLTRSDAADRLVRARQVLSAASASTIASEEHQYQGLLADTTGYPVPEVLQEMMPQGLGRGNVTVVRGSVSLLTSLLGEVSGTSVWIVLLGLPEIGLAALEQQGIELTQLVLIPDPGALSATAVAAALDGFDVVVCGPHVVLSDHDRRRLTSKVRQTRSVLLSSLAWPGAALELTAQRCQWYGVDAGGGWLQGTELTVTCSGRRAIPGQHAQAIDLWTRRAG